MRHAPTTLRAATLAASAIALLLVGACPTVAGDDGSPKADAVPGASAAEHDVSALAKTRRGEPPALSYPGARSLSSAADSSAEVVLGSAFLTYDGDEPLAGWSFAIAVTDGAPTDTTLTTDDEGVASLTVEVAGSSARVEVAQTAKDPYSLENSQCIDEDGTVGTRDEPTLVFDAVPGHRYFCGFVYSEPSSSAAEVWVDSWIGTGPDLKHLKTTRHLAVTGGQPDYDTIPNPNQGPYITIAFAPGPATAHVEITEDRTPGLRLTKAGCSVREFGEETGGTGRLVGSALVFEAQPRHHYFCSLYNEQIRDAPTTETLPPTDASGGISSHASKSPSGLALIAALVGSALGCAHVIRKRTSGR